MDTREKVGMDYNWFWLISKSFHMGLIDKQKVISLWRIVQEIGADRKQAAEEKA